MSESKEKGAARPNTIEEAKARWSVQDRQRLQDLADAWTDSKETRQKLGGADFADDVGAQKVISDADTYVLQVASGLRELLPTSIDLLEDTLDDNADELDALVEALKDK